MCEIPLSQLPPHNAGIIEKIDTSSIGDALANRLVGLGFTRGTSVVRLFCAPGGDPRAYLVRGAAVALRNSDAACVIVSADGDRV